MQGCRPALPRKCPEWLGKIALIQVTVPTRMASAQTHKLQRQVQGLVGRINGRFGALHYTPIHYLNTAPSSEELAALYMLADVCLVTPVRDGMNLVSQEFLACKWHGSLLHPHSEAGALRDPPLSCEPGVVIISEFAGSAQSLLGAAVRDHAAW